MEHQKVLDGLRAIAVLIVIVSHAGLGHIVPGGLGVTLFFFLSGYLITTLMVIEWDKTSKLDFRGFYLRRTVRIIPPMLLCIFVTLLLTWIGIQPREIRTEGLVWDFLFLSNYALQLGTSSGLPIPLWSLAVEEHFYLIFPSLFVLMMLSGSPKSIITTICALILAALAIRIAIYASGANVGAVYYWSHTRIDSILFGCLLALVNNPATEGRTYIDGRLIYFLIGVAMILSTLLIRDEWFRETWRYTVQGAALWLIFNNLLRADNIVTNVLSSRFLKPTADYSYVLYLIHLPLMLSASQLALPPIAQNMVGIAAAYAFAAFSYRFAERPLLHWRKAYQKSRRRPLKLRPKGLD